MGLFNGILMGLFLVIYGDLMDFNGDLMDFNGKSTINGENHG